MLKRLCQADAGDPRWRRRLHSAVLFLMFVLCGRFYFQSAADDQGSLGLEPAPVSYHSQLADAFLHGQLSLRAEPKRELLALPDPYDPALNPPYPLHDASLYRGKYYLYFGAAPALVLHLPVRMLTGYYPSDAVAVLIFLLAGLALWLAVF